MKKSTTITLPILPPKVVTLLTTFKCTAQCNNCCFQCSPKSQKKMSFNEMKTWLGKCLDTYPTIKIVVFSGGECTLLGKSLLDIIAFVSSREVSTRIVTNAWWAKSYDVAYDYVAKLKERGLTEINFSTGDEHQQWVPFGNVRNAALAAYKQGIMCAINIETHDQSAFDFNKCLLKDKLFASCCSNMLNDGKSIYIEHGVWAPMNEKSKEVISYEKFRGSLNYKTCENLFDNIPINPYGEVLACCGITSEQNPYLRIGNITDEDIKTIYGRSFMDILKVWLFVSGPISILHFIDKKRESIQNIVPQHMCMQCKQIFSNSEYLSILREHIDEYAPAVLLKYNIIVKQLNRL